MNTIRKWIRDLFGFSGKEINGFLILLPLMVMIILAQPLYHLWIAEREQDFSGDAMELDSLMARLELSPGVGQKPETVLLFKFDPNKASVEDFEALGFTEILATRIASYRQKGGRFRIKSDLTKIYGMDTSFYRQLYPFIMLPERAEKRIAARDSIFSRKTGLEQRNDILLSFDLNEADTIRFKSVYGIGSVLARRIVRYRNGLGGFIKVEQLHEVYGLDSMAINRLLKIAYIKQDFVPKKINMNEADEKEFSAHPYIKRNMANAIVAYRFQHGNFARVEDLRKLSQLKETDIVKLLPYLRTDD
jgi:DNA uptake protein ComE-like DNA-binding protein